MTATNKLLVVQVAGLGFDLAQQRGLTCGGRAFQPMESVFPAVTCPVQASFRTALPPVAHGVVSNGLYCRKLQRTAFWEQSTALVDGPRIWDDFRRRGGTVGLVCWQQSLGENADVILSPAPIHKHHGGMIEDCYSQPAGLYARLCGQVGRPFRLAHYWGPFSSAKSSQWIAEATAALLAIPEIAPDLCLTYLPVLDYDLQRYGPSSAAADRAVGQLRTQLALLAAAAERTGYELLVFGDYAIAPCAQGAVLPNRVLQEAGLLAVRRVGGRMYADLHASRAFAMCDHEVAQVYVRQPGDVAAVQALLAAQPGVDWVRMAGAMAEAGLAHANSGELVMQAAEEYWLAYPWWRHRAEAPDYAGHVDIHNKPGYDPCELFLGWPPGTVSQNTQRIRGSHGRVGEGRKTCWASTAISGKLETVIDLATHVRDWLEHT